MDDIVFGRGESRGGLKRWRSALVAGLLVSFALPGAVKASHTFTVAGGRFLLDGKPFLIRSGELHYARIPRAYWRDRLLKARAMGLNAVCTYVFWNYHEEAPGHFDFAGERDLAAFVAEAGRAGLLVVLRPGPYVCAEWDFGGLPAWLLKEPDLRVRCRDPRFLEAAGRYLARLGKEVRELQVTRGGPIALVQLENEYGSYGNDRGYLEWLQGALGAAGFEVPLFTSDGPLPRMLEAGALPGVPPLVNFGGDAPAAFLELERFRPGTPPGCGEFWCGWFTHWGNPAWGAADWQKQRGDVEWMLANRKSFNLYMLHGGTSFGFWAGANFDTAYRPDITSYDYDAPLDEAGRPTAKYFALRELLRSHGAAPASLPAPLAAIDLAPVEFRESAPLLGHLPAPRSDVQPRPMERYGQNHGLILYRTRLRGPKSGRLAVREARDFAWVFLDHRLVGTLDRTRGEEALDLPASDSPGPQLDILVEAMGRVNFGAAMLDPKGISERVTLAGVTLMDWQVFPLPLGDDFRRRLVYSAGGGGDGPRFWRARFDLRRTGDTFLDLSNWRKGLVWVNGRNLGRYWERGPQRDLFLPGAWLRRGENEMVVLELNGSPPAAVGGRRDRRR